MSELKAETIVPQGTTITLQMYPKSEADKYIARQKYKRCLAMAKWCDGLHQFHETIERNIWLHKWSNRWLKLAEQFKEAK